LPKKWFSITSVKRSLSFGTKEKEIILFGSVLYIDFIYFLSNINYMFPKAHGIAYLREAITMMFYKTKFNKEYNEIMLEKSIKCR